MTLLAALALAVPQAVRRDELIDVLWPETLPSDAGAILSTLLSRLRRVLGADAIEGRAELRLVLPIRVDVELARELVIFGRAALEDGRWADADAVGAEAAEKLAGGFLPGVTGSWVDRRREEVRGLEADALEIMVEGRLRGGGDAETAARRLIELAPYRESGHRARMEALARRGNVAEALLAYEDVRRLLRDDLGIDPSPGLREIHRLLVSGEAAVEPPSSRRLPLPSALRDDGPFVGRTAELAQLREAAPGDLVLIAGEPGIGKTALAARFAAEAFDGGALVLYGHCDEHAPIPFQPFVEALRHWVSCAPADELSARLPPSAEELALLLPELRRRLPGAPVASDPETRRYRLFEAIHELLSELAAHAPVVLVLDDLQWAEPSSLVLLRHLLRRGGGSALVIGAYRPTEASPELLALPAIMLDGLEEVDVAQLVGHPLAPKLHRDTGGNPLFVGEVVRHLEETGADLAGPLELPGRVREVIARRLARLSEEAQRALAVAAVAGSEFELDVVAAAADRSADALAETLEEPIAARLVCEVAGDPGRYRFAHALIRTTVESGLTETRRERLHRRVADALPRARAAERAQHRYAAGETGAAVVAAADEAARAAAGVLAYEEAVRHYQHAVAAVEDDPTFPAADRCDLLLALAGALRDAGAGAHTGDASPRGLAAPPRAAKASSDPATVALRAAAAAREAGDAERLARAALAYAGPGWGVTGVSDPGAVALLEEAAAELGVDDELLRARVLSRLAVELYWSPLRDRRRALAREAVELCRVHGDEGALAVALTAEHWCAWGPDTLDERLALITEAGQAARAAHDVDLVVECRLWELGDHLEQGRVDAIDAVADAVERIAHDDHRLRWLPWPALLRTTSALAHGRFDAASNHLAAADRRGHFLKRDSPALSFDRATATSAATADGAANLKRDSPSLDFLGALADEPEWLARRVLLAIARGGLDAVEPAVARTADRLPALPIWRVMHAWVLARMGRHQEAAAAFERFARHDFAHVPRDMHLVVSCAIAAEVCDPTRAGALYDLLLPYRDRHAVAPTDFTLGSVERPLGLLATAAGALDTADEHFTLAARGNARLKPWLAETELAHARVLTARDAPGDAERALALARRGRSTARALGLTALLSPAWG